MKLATLLLAFFTVSAVSAAGILRCSKPVSPRFGNWRATVSSYTVGSRVTYYCLPGYRLVGNARTTCVNNRLRTFWTGRVPSCVRLAVVRSCPDFGAPDNGRRVLAGIKPGDSVQFYCNAGFELQGSAQLTCQDNGKWSGSAPKCVVAKPTSCSRPVHPHHGLAWYRANLAVGSLVVYECTRGYKLRGVARRTCLPSGQWSGTSPSCEVIHCPDPGIPPFGHRDMKKTTVGAIATFSCNSGYKLVGEASIICHNLGVWSRAKPVCRRIAAGTCPDPGTPQNGWRDLDSLEEYATVKYYCNSGYVLVGSDNRKCLSGKWDGALPTCRGVTVDCGNPGDIANGFKTLSDGTVLHSTVTYFCNVGYVLRGRSTRLCASNGRWTGTVPKCVTGIVNCGPPGSPSNGGVNVDKTTAGGLAVYSCKEGFVLSGSVQRVCKLNGKWSGSVPSCNIVDCGDPGTPDNGQRDLSSTVLQALVQYSCDEGFSLVGDRMRFCLATGKWSGFLPTCKLVDCGDPGTPTNGGRQLSSTTFRSAVRYNCNDGFSLEGNEVRICQASGEWTGFLPTCTRLSVDCGSPGTPSNGRSDYTETTVGSLVRHSCVTGYVLSGDSVRSCLPSGVWSGSLPTCRLVDCGDPGTPTNGGRQLLSTTFRSAVRYNCNNGFSLDGNEVRICQASGEWTGFLPTCKRLSVDCGSPGTPSNGRSDYTETTVRSLVRHSCVTGYVLSGDSVRSCLPSGVWSGSLPTCRLVDCGDPGTPTNGGRQLSSTTFRSAVRYNCNNGFSLDGNEVRICQASGEWTGFLPTCTRLSVDCGSPGTPSNGRSDYTETTVGSLVRHSCVTGYVLSGDSVRNCLPSGAWSGSLPTCRLVDCGDPGTPTNGGRQLSSTTFRSAVQYNCNDGFSLEGNEVRICQASGEWTGFLPTCTRLSVDCGSPGTPSNGRSDYTETTVGSLVRHSCVTGYVLSGDSVRSCLPSGVWSGSLPTCRPINCGDPGTPLNGGRDLTGTTLFRTVLYFCNDGFTLVGITLRRCGQNGAWSGSVPTCREDAVVDCGQPEFIEFGSVDVPTTVEGSVARYSCRAGYRLRGASTRTCLSSGVWSGVPPVCDAIDCGIPPSPRGGVIQLTSTLFGSEVTYVCNDGYVLSGSRVRRCGIGGVWSGRAPTCQRVDCGDPGAPVNGDRELSETVFGSRVVYSCSTGYVLVGDDVRVCQRDATWSGDLPTCAPLDCGDPGTPLNGGRQLTTTTLLAVVTYFCLPGYTLTGPASRECENDGRWSASLPTCTAVDCGDPGTPVNGVRRLTTTTLNSVVIYECSRGYELDRSSSRVCQASGAWSGLLPVCRALSCNDPGTPTNGKRTITTRTVGSEVMFSCNNGYTLIGDTIQVCQPDQTWSGALPRCVLVDCGDPGLPLNAARVLTGTTFSSHVTYTCSVNFMLSGEETRLCQADGTWSGTLPSCERKELVMCGDPGLPENGQRIVSSNLVTAVVTYSCNEAYFLVGDIQRTCLPSGQWSGATPSCQSINCGVPEKPSNAIIIGTNFTFGASVEYQCTGGYVLVGLRTRTCRRDQTWSGDVPFCKESELKECDDPGVPENGRRFGDNLSIGSTIYFQCFDGYELIGERFIICQPGALWTSNGPFCRVKVDTCVGDGVEAYDSCQRLCTCRGGITTNCCRLRRDWLSMNIADKLQYLDAVVQASTDPAYKPQYESLVLLYRQLADSLVHSSDPTVSQFIPWHRYFLLEYENLLRQINCNITIPYWDWTAFSKNPYVSAVFDIDTGFGDSSRLNDTCVNVGLFSVNNWVLPASVGGGCLMREYMLRSYPTRDSIDRDILPNPVTEFGTVHRQLQLVIHNVARCNIGGTMCTAGDGAADPLYILHLSRIDSIYSQWQDLKMGRQLIRYSNDNTLLTGTNSLTIADFSNNRMLPYEVAVCYDAPFELKNFHPGR